MEPQQSQSRRDRAVALIRAGLELLRDPSPDEPITVQRELELLDAIRVAAEQLQTQHRVMAADADRRKVAERAVGVPLTTWLKSTGRTTQAVAAATIFAGHDLAAHPEVRAAALEGSVTSRQSGGTASKRSDRGWAKPPGAGVDAGTSALRRTAWPGPGPDLAGA